MIKLRKWLAELIYSPVAHKIRIGDTITYSRGNEGVFTGRVHYFWDWGVTLERELNEKNEWWSYNATWDEIISVIGKKHWKK